MRSTVIALVATVAGCVAPGLPVDIEATPAPTAVADMSPASNVDISEPVRVCIPLGVACTDSRTCCEPFGRGSPNFCQPLLDGTRQCCTRDASGNVVCS